MNPKLTLHPIPEGFPSLPTYTANWRAVRFELTPGTGEWLTCHIALVDKDGATVRQTIRPETLRALFGSNARHFQSLLDMVEKSFSTYLAHEGNLSSWMAPLEGFSAAEVKTSYARNGRAQALRMAVRQSTALCNLEDLELPDEQISLIEDEKESGLWAIRIKDAVSLQRPDLKGFFDRSGMPYAESVKFGFLTDTSAAHFANLRPYGLAQSMRLARSKIQELRIGARTMNLQVKTLIAGVPNYDDVTLSETQITNARRAQSELSQEAQESNIDLVAESPRVY